MLSAHSWRACAGTGWADSSQWEVANSRSARECTSILGSGSTGRSALTLPRSASSKWALACISASTLTPSLYAQCPGDYLNGRKLRSALEVTAGTGRRVLLHGNGGYMPSSSGPALTGGRGSSSRPRGGVISGYAFRVIREQLDTRRKPSPNSSGSRRTPSRAGNRAAVRQRPYPSGRCWCTGTC